MGRLHLLLLPRRRDAKGCIPSAVTTTHTLNDDDDDDLPHDSAIMVIATMSVAVTTKCCRLAMIIFTGKVEMGRRQRLVVVAGYLCSIA
mmetsp:Transcript_7868/g.19645  ORF Transcript_7868/g.19645 Transcript_7868/m.19645 type:complete len:89 (-) Transcript_7868:44-310(-)